LLHYTYQDILNEENGGITSLDDFESEDADLITGKITGLFTDAKSFSERVFFRSLFRINPKRKVKTIYS
jgi:hypothetical protein